jgi:nascent polypeptide-associated complex subunit alpha
VKLRSVVPSVDHLLQSLTHNQTEDINSSAQLSDIQHLPPSGTGVPALTEKPAGGDVDVGDDDYIPEFEDDDDDDTPEFEGPTHEQDINLVMQQAGCSRARAVQALGKNYGDLIDASTCQSQRFLVRLH